MFFAKMSLDHAVFFLLILPVSLGMQTISSSSLVWESKTAFPGAPRHHPITFANETHAFLLTGSINDQSVTNDFYLYDAARDVWTDLSNTSSAYPGEPRSFGYGVVLNVAFHPKAYIGMGLGEATLLNDLWEFDMVTHAWKQLSSMPVPGRRHPAMNAVRKATQLENLDEELSDQWEIHVGLGDGSEGNLNDWWIYDIATDTWQSAPDLPAIGRHHPFHFTLGTNSYAGLGHSSQGIERDWFRLENGTWIAEPDFESYNDDGVLATSEARVAGTQFSIELNVESPVALLGSIGFVLSGDGDDHGSMIEGEFHAFDRKTGQWHILPPHPGPSRWAPGSFVMRGSAVAYFTSGYDRTSQALFNDVWRIDLSPLFMGQNNTNISPSPNTVLPPAASPSSMDDIKELTSAAWILGFSFQLLICLTSFLLDLV